VVWVECSPEAQQVKSRLRSFLNERSHNALVAQPCTGSERVTHVILLGVSRIEHSCKAALCPLCRTGFEHVFGDNENATNRADRSRY
jgi:hypothetical protein